MTTILRRKDRRLPPLPPGLEQNVASAIPYDLLDDAIQEAWLASLTGDDPTRAVWRFVRRMRRQRAAMLLFRDLDSKTLRRINELTG
jgi:hypothetical protein